MNGLVSIITPTYNSSQFIEHTINSILQQTYSDWELIITDDCSRDNTYKIINDFAKTDKRIKIFRLDQNSGPAVARNNSLKNANGRYIAFCDSDDMWHPDKLEKQVKFLQDMDLPFTFSSYQKIDENGTLGSVIYAPSSVSYNELLKTCSIGCLTVIFDAAKIGKVYFPEAWKRQEDYGMWLIIFKKIGSAKGMYDVLAIYRERTNSVSSNKLKTARDHYRVLREVANIPHLKASYFFIFYVINGIKKYFK
jgi:teichuronic acid biosynthesis glycosyltransferase TuaG